MKARLIASVSNSSDLFAAVADIAQNNELKDVVKCMTETYPELKHKPTITGIVGDIQMSTTGNILSWLDGMNETINLYERI